MSDKRCVHKISSPKTTIVVTDKKTELGQFVCQCTECLKTYIFEKLPEKLRK
jgi:hypothetical protein